MRSMPGQSARSVPSEIVVLEGTRGGGAGFAARIGAHATKLRPFHWRAAVQAIVPGFRDGSAQAREDVGDDLRQCWALLPWESTFGAPEVMLIEDHTRALGWRLALVMEHSRAVRECELLALASADAVLFPTESDRQAALETVSQCRTMPAPSNDRWYVADSSSGAFLTETLRDNEVVPPSPVQRILYWCGLTASQPFNTGVQRVTRMLGTALERLSIELVPVRGHDSGDRLSPLSEAEARRLSNWNGPSSRLSGSAGAIATSHRVPGDWILVPEIPVPVILPGSTIPRLARSLGLRSAMIFYDLIPLKMPDLYPDDVLDAFVRYWDSFAEVDLALPISWTVAADLRLYLAARGLRIPPLVPIPLAGEFLKTSRLPAPLPTRAPDAHRPLRFLAVGTWEPRKNYPRLLRALAQARGHARMRPIGLTLVGRRAGYDRLDEEIENLAAELDGIVLRDHVSDEELHDLFQASHATLYGSWEEGFGLPVLESIWHGLPCVCHNGSALSETAAGGGVLLVNMLDETAIAAALVQLADDDSLLLRLAGEASKRHVRTWDTYARDVLSAIAHPRAARDDVPSA